MKRLVLPVAALALLLGGCTTSESTSTSAGDMRPEEFLAAHGLAGMDAVEIIDHLDRLSVEDRPAALMASVQPEDLVLSANGEGTALELPEGSSYVSIAPYVTQTHDCFYHSLTTCLGELGEKDVQVQITDDATGETIIDEQAATFDNGFIGFWIPKNIQGTITVNYDGLTGESDFSTTEDGATCITDLQVA